MDLTLIWLDFPLLSPFRVTQVYLAIDDRLTSLKTDTFSKTREEKMEDLFAQKDVGSSPSACLYLWVQWAVRGHADVSVCV